MPQLALIFDLDGTLLDSTHVWQEIDEVFLGKRGLAVPPDYVPAIASMNLRQAAEYTKARFGFPETENEIIAEWHSMAKDAYAEQIPLKPGAADVLRAFSEKGCAIALATASDPAYYLPALQRCGVYEYFTRFVHSRPGLLKGNAAFYLHCAEELHAAPQNCLVFEDVLPGILAAKAAGMQTAAIEDIGSLPDREKLCQAADFYFSSWSEVLASPLFH